LRIKIIDRDLCQLLKFVCSDTGRVVKLTIA